MLIIFASGLIAKNSINNIGTAATMPANRWELGLFSPLKYGLNSNTELSSYHIPNFFIPNIAIKHHWGDHRKYSFSSKHSFSYPTPLLNLIAREGAGGLLPDNSIIPNIITFNNEFILNYRFSQKLTLIKFAGYSFAYINGKSDFPTLDYPLLYNHSCIFQGSGSLKFGTAIDFHLYDNLRVFLCYDNYFLAAKYSKYYMEASGKVIWNFNDKYSLIAGAKMVYADYPSAKQQNYNIFPILDFKINF